jgi:branched-chain amino acid transport system ATP-binding protein
MLKLTNVHTRYGPITVLKNISLHVAEGEIVTLIGANGAGKTTLLQTISGIVSSWEGDVFFYEQRINKASPEDIVRLGISQVPEGRQVFSPLTVAQNLELGAYHRNKKNLKEEIAGDLEKVFSLFPRLKERIDQTAGTLSGGEQQMLAIGRALMANPRLLLLDEPSLGLAPKLVDIIFETILRLNAEGKTVLLVEQNAKKALEIASRGYVIETGRIILQGPASELIEDKDVQRAYLGKDYKDVTS